MKYIIDNDLHIHSGLSSCSSDPEQNSETILRYAKDNGLRTVCLTNHFWDEAVGGASSWYAPQNYPHLASAKPLPQDDNVRFLFGCEADLDRFLTLGVSKEKQALFDFIVISTTHFQMKGFTLFEEDTSSVENRANAWIKRLAAVLDMDLPFHKVGIAHLTCKLIAPQKEERLAVLRLIPDDTLVNLFSRAAKRGVGIELNASDMNFSDDEADTVLRIYKVAKQCGCKFYLGSDAHHPEEFLNLDRIFGRAIDLLALTEDDKFII